MAFWRMFKNRTNNATPHTSPRPQPSDGLSSPSENNFSPSSSDPPLVSSFMYAPSPQPLYTDATIKPHDMPPPPGPAPASVSQGVPRHVVLNLGDSTESQHAPENKHALEDHELSQNQELPPQFDPSPTPSSLADLPRPATDAPTLHNPAPNEDEQEPTIYPKGRPMSFMPGPPDARGVPQDQINRPGPASEQAPPRLGIADDDPMPQAQQIHARDDKGHQKNILDDEADITGVFRSETSKRPKPLPPTSAAVESYGALLSPEALTSEQFPPFGPIASNKSAASQKQNEDPTQKPTCTLNLVCYSRGCSLSQIQVTLASKFEKEEQYKKLLAAHPKVITTDRQLFDGLRDRYQNDICGFWRRLFSLKTLRTVRLLSYTPHTRPTPVPFDEMTMREVLYAYNHPSEFGPETDWVEWVFRLRQQDKRHALEFVEGWNGTRIAVLGMIPCVASTLVGAIWSVRGGDVQTAFTVAAFILTVATVLLALLAIVSGIDSKPR